MGRLSDFWRRRPSPDPGPGIFTAYVRSLDARGEPPDSQAFREILKALRRPLRAEIQKRGLWDAPPSHLGVYGWRHWDEGADGGALDELLADCYWYIFSARLRSLQAQLLDKRKPNIEGLVVLNIRHFVHDRQKEHDPLGTLVFEVLWATLRAAVDAGELHILAGDAKIRNDTILGFEPGADPGMATRAELHGVAARWSDDLLPDLVTLRGRQQEEIVERLRGRLGDLREEGRSVFRFKDLIDPLKAEVRAWCAAILEQGEGDLAVEKGDGGPPRRLRTVAPEARLEEWQIFQRLIDCVLRRLARLKVSHGTRRHLETLWQFVRIQAQGATEGPLTGMDVVSLVRLADEERPSHRKIAEALRIPRDRIRELYATLGELLTGCRALPSGRAGAMSLPSC